MTPPALKLQGKIKRIVSISKMLEETAIFYTVAGISTGMFTDKGVLFIFISVLKVTHEICYLYKRLLMA